MSIKQKKDIRQFLKAITSFILISAILFFQYFLPLYSSAICSSNICGPNCISMDPDTCTCFPIGCNGISTSTSTSGGAMCSTGQPACQSGQNYVCPSGGAPCCLFSNEAGCSLGLSCFGGQGFCGTSNSTSSTSSTGGGVIMCGGDSTPDCPSGQTFLCQSGEAPCCIQFSDEAGCSRGLSCFGGRGVCGTSTTSTTSSTGGSTIMCGGDSTPDCPSGQTFLCQSGGAPCCIQFSDEAGCSFGLSCFGGRGSCVTSTSSTSTSSTSGGVIMCGGDNTPDCPSGQTFLCQSGGAPCCIQFSDEAGCGFGLSCFGGRGSCVTSTSSTSTSSTSGGVIMCGGDNTPDCPSGQTFLCQSGGAPCCIQFSDEAGCSFGLSCFGGQGSCIVSSSTSSSGGSSSTSSSSSGGNNPFCLNGQIMCNIGTPTCPTGQTPDCGSNYGLTGEFSGQGCITQSMNFFFVNGAFCSQSQRVISSTQQIQTCESNLCPTNRERFQSCREDRTSCKCVCPFKTKNEKTTPRCDSNNQPACSDKLNPICSRLSNIVVCLDGKLLCQDKGSGSIDFTDIIFCKKIK